MKVFFQRFHGKKSLEGKLGSHMIIWILIDFWSFNMIFNWSIMMTISNFFWVWGVKNHEKMVRFVHFSYDIEIIQYSLFGWQQSWWKKMKQTRFWGSSNVSKNACFIMDNPRKLDDLGVPLWLRKLPHLPKTHGISDSQEVKNTGNWLLWNSIGHPANIQ